MLSIDDIDEAIQYCEEVAENQEWMAENYDDDSVGKKQCEECASKYRQIAKGLTELKAWRKFDESRRMKCEED